jgi:hypothetical protein
MYAGCLVPDDARENVYDDREHKVYHYLLVYYCSINDLFST